MEISNLFFNQLKFSADNLKQNIVSTTATNTATTKSFDNHYESYKNDYNSKNLDVNKTSNNDNIKKTSKTIKNDDMKKAKIDSNSSNKESKTEEEIGEEFVEELAEKLNVSVDEIKDLLNELNMTVFDLLNVNNFNTFMQNFLDIQNPVDILASEQTQQLYKQVAEVVKDYKQIYNEFQSNITLVKQSPDIELSNENIDTKATKASETIVSNNNNNLHENQQVSTETLEQEQKDVQTPIVEVKNSNNQSNSNFKEQTPNEVLLTQNTNQDFNYSNISGYQQFQQQAVIDNIASKVSNTSTDAHQIINQIVEKIKVDIKPDVSEMKLLLKPDTLGELSLKITTQNNIVTAQFVAESQQVKEVLQANFNNLKDTLQQLGLVIDEISVSVGQQDSQPRQQFEQSQQKSRHRMSQIINNINTSDEAEVLENRINPYNLKNTQVDYMA